MIYWNTLKLSIVERWQISIQSIYWYFCLIVHYWYQNSSRLYIDYIAFYVITLRHIKHTTVNTVTIYYHFTTSTPSLIILTSTYLFNESKDLVITLSGVIRNGVIVTCNCILRNYVNWMNRFAINSEHPSSKDLFAENAKWFLNESIMLSLSKLLKVIFTAIIIYRIFFQFTLVIYLLN